MSKRYSNVFAIVVSFLKSPSRLIIAIVVAIGIGLPYSNYETNGKPAFNLESIHFTRAEYERLQIGMQLVEVQGILGRGTEMRRTNKSSVFIWENPDSSKITATFEYGQLIVKNWE